MSELEALVDSYLIVGFLGGFAALIVAHFTR